MRTATREESIDVIKASMRSRMAFKGIDPKSISDEWLNDKAAQIYEETKDGDPVQVLEPLPPEHQLSIFNRMKSALRRAKGHE